jgi:HTH-type transcriptional regulator, repressor for puuD
MCPDMWKDGFRATSAERGRFMGQGRADSKPETPPQREHPSGHAGEPEPPRLVLRPEEIPPFDRGSGVVTVPFVGKWNCQSNRITSGMTVFQVDTAIPLHAHNVEESVLVFRGEATAVIGDDRFDLEEGQATWVPAGVPHCFVNRGRTPMTIYWVYGGRDVTRTIWATGETFEHLSSSDRGAIVQDMNG